MKKYMENFNSNWLNYFSFILLIVLFAPLFKPLFKDWYDYPDNSHGFLIIPVSLYLIWLKKDTLKEKSIQFSSRYLLVFFIMLLGYLIFTIGDIVFLSRYFLLFVLISYIVVAYGYNIFKELLFPLIYLFFMIPLPASIVQPVTLPLQLFVSKISVFFLQLINIPIYREGNILHLSSGILEVAPACSGLRSIVSLLSISILMAYFFQEKFWRQTICFFAAIPIAVATNFFRIAVTVILYHYYGESTTNSVLHESWGMIVFILSMVLLYILNIVVKRYFEGKK